jgi:hypothetical protein
MPPHSTLQPSERGGLRLQGIRLGVFGLLVVGVGIALGWFALFGCGSTSSGAKRDIEGMTVNPPDAYMKRWTK